MRTLLGAALVGATAVAGVACASSSRSSAPPASAPPVPFTCPAGAATVGTSAAGPAPGHKLSVATTVAPITSIVANVAGDRARIEGVIPEGQDSHTFEPKPSVAALFAQADVVFANGLALEAPTTGLAREHRRAAAEVVELGSTILPSAGYIYDFSFPRDGGKPNPHLWTNPVMARCYAVAAASVLAKADPANAAAYQANAARFEAKLDDLDTRFRAASATVPAGNRKLLTYHDAYAYFAVQYGWKVIGAVQVSSFEDPTPKQVAALIAQVKREGVPAIFGSEVFPSSVLAQIGREAHVKYVDALRDDDLPGRPGDPDHSYLGLMKADFVTMISNLGGDPSGLATFDAGDVVRDTAVYPQ